SLCLLFFFQAEDGIRDFHVTGVQTCALPISVTTKITSTLSLGCLPQIVTNLESKMIPIGRKVKIRSLYGPNDYLEGREGIVVDYNIVQGTIHPVTYYKVRIDDPRFGEMSFLSWEVVPLPQKEE